MILPLKSDHFIDEILIADGVWQKCCSQSRIVGGRAVCFLKLVDHVQQVIGVSICLKGGWKRLGGRGIVSYLFAVKKSIRIALNRIRFTFPFSFSFISCNSPCLPFLCRICVEGYFLFPEVEGEALTAFGWVESGGAGGASWWIGLIGHTVVD